MGSGRLETPGLLAAAPPPAAGREVPLRDVVALDEMLLEEAAIESTVAVEPAVEAGARAEVRPAFDAINAPLFMLAETAGVVDTGARPAAEDGVSSAFPGDADRPAPAPEDEPAVFDAMDVVEGEPARADWM